MPDGYSIRQAAMDREYGEEYQRWIASLSAEERATLEQDGLDEADTSRSGGSRDELDENRMAALAPDEAQTDPHTPPTPGQNAGDILASFVARIRSCPNPLMVFDAVAYGTGMLALDGVSLTEIAKRHNMTRAALSKIGTRWVKTFGLTPSRGMKSARARKVYAALTRSRWHERNHRQSR